MSERVNTLIEYLQGTCKSLSEACNEHDIEHESLTQAELDELDNHIFECPVCNWWYETSEMQTADNGENVCSECLEDSNNE